MGEILVGVDSVAHCGHRYLTHSTIAAQSRDHLHVIIVTDEWVGTGFHVTTEFLIIHIHEISLSYGRCGAWACVTLLAVGFHHEALRHPLVPLCNHQHLGMHGDGTVELFGKETSIRSLCGESVFVHRWLATTAVTLAYLGIGVHGCSHRHLFTHRGSCLSGVVDLLRIIGQPRPFILALLPCPTVAHGEEGFGLIADISLLCGIYQYQRFTVPVKPILIVGLVLIPFLIEVIHHIPSTAMTAESQFGRTQAKTGAPVYLIDDCLYLIVISKGIGDVEEIEIHSCIHQHLHMFGHDISVSSRIIPQGWLTAPMEL